MGDQPYAALLPLIVFSVVDRWGGQGTTWAAIAALITMGAVYLTSSRMPEARNAFVAGVAAWFTMLAIFGLIFQEADSWLGRYGRALGALGYGVIALATLARTPAAQHYTRLFVRRRRWNDASFLRMNYALTIIWGVTFLLIGCSFALGPIVDQRPGYTVLNWVAPIAIGLVGAHRARMAWDDFNDPELENQLDMWELAFDTDYRPADPPS
jgi:hypothetical protein